MMSDNGASHNSRWQAFDPDRLLRHSFVVFIFTHAVGAVNVLFQMVMGWNLSLAEYGVLSSMLGLMMALAAPMTAISNTMAHFTSNLIKEGKESNIRALARQWINRISGAIIPLLILLVILRNSLALFFHLATPWPLLLVGLSLFVSVLAMVFGGVLQGMQAFVPLGFPGLAGGLMRLCLGGILVFAVAPEAVCGLLAHFLGALCATALLYFFYHRRLRQSAQTDITPERSDRYFWASMAAFFSFAILMNMDVVMVKRYFTVAEDYGSYARASTIARTLVFLVQPIVGAMFPKVVSRGSLTKEQKFTLFRSLGLAGLIVIGGLLLCTLFPQIPLLILYRDHTPSAQMLALVRKVSWAMAPLGLVFILMNFELAQHRLTCIIPLALCAVAFVGGVALFHDSLRQVVAVFTVVSFSALFLLIALHFGLKKKLECPRRA